MGSADRRRFYVIRYMPGGKRSPEGPYTHRDARKAAMRYHQQGFPGRLGIAVDSPDGREFEPRFPGVIFGAPPPAAVETVTA